MSKIDEAKEILNALQVVERSKKLTTKTIGS